MKMKEENEFIELIERLYDRFGIKTHYTVTKAEKTENGWILQIENVDDKPAEGGAENESN